jgi:uncharacterized protein (DUF4415 family)
MAGPNILFPEQPESGFRAVCETIRQFTRSRADSRRDHPGATSPTTAMPSAARGRRPPEVRHGRHERARKHTDAAKADPDAQSTDREFWKNAKLCSRSKQPGTLRVDQEGWIGSEPKRQRYQSRMNAVLRSYMEEHWAQ